MKIAINCMFCTPQSGGIKEYIVNLTNSLSSVDHENEYLLYVLEDQYDYARCVLPSKWRIKILPYKSDLYSKIKRSLFSQRYWSKEEKVERFQLFHSPFFYAPSFEKAKLVITVHDLRLYRFPQTYPLLRFLYLRYSVERSLRCADAIISVSQFTKDEIVECCKISEDKIVVIHEAINRELFSEDALEDNILPSEYEYLNYSRFIFTLGHVEPRKNYIRLLRAFEMVKALPKHHDLKLVIAGRLNWKSKEVQKALKQSKDVIFLNFIPRKLLLWLYKKTALFVFPSYYEGFGFPPLEAASLGTVSAVSKISSIPEVCGESAFYFDPYNIQNISDVISSCLEKPELIEEKRKKLSSQLDQFSWAKNAEKTLIVYKSLFPQHGC